VHTIFKRRFSACRWLGLQAEFYSAFVVIFIIHNVILFSFICLQLYLFLCYSQTMNVEIIIKPLRLDIYGFSGVAINKDYAGTAFRLMDKMWQTVKTNGLKHKGINIWVYELNEKVFAGVELDGSPNHNTGLEQKNITLEKYAYYKHVGPYHLIKQTGQSITDELKKKGFETSLPYIEIYGHWTNDETKLETELLMCLKQI
jgi:effector-binding domain-containing protein